MRRRYWQARLVLIQGKCLRYQGKYEEARATYGQVLELLEQPATSGPSDAMLWRARARAARSQCSISLGELGVAAADLDEAERLTATAEPSAQTIGAHLTAVRGLIVRHRATIDLVSGALDKAEALLLTLEHNAPDGKPRAVTLHKLAKVRIERVRAHEASFPESSAEHEEIEQQLADADTTLRHSHASDRRWHIAIELAKIEHAIIACRSGCDHVATAERAFALRDRIGRMKLRTSRRAVTPQSAVWLDFDVLEHSCGYQVSLDGLAESGGAKTFYQLLHDDLESLVTRDGSDDRYAPKPHPYQRSRQYYEIAYYALRLQQWLDANPTTGTASDDHLKRDVSGDLARVYRFGLNILYSHDLFDAARPFHLLLSAGVTRLNSKMLRLQERLEAALWVDPPAVRPLLDEIAWNAWHHFSAEIDEYIVIPAKVMSRLRSDFTRYRILKRSGLAGAIEGASEPDSRIPEPVYMVAHTLLIETIAWCAVVQRGQDYWDRIAASRHIAEFETRADVLGRRVKALYELLAAQPLSAPRGPGTASIVTRAVGRARDGAGASSNTD